MGNSNSIQDEDVSQKKNQDLTQSMISQSVLSYRTTDNNDKFVRKKKKCCQKDYQSLKNEDWFKHMLYLQKNDFYNFEWSLLVIEKLQIQVQNSYSQEHQQYLKQKVEQSIFQSKELHSKESESYGGSDVFQVQALQQRLEEIVDQQNIVLNEEKFNKTQSMLVDQTVFMEGGSNQFSNQSNKSIFDEFRQNQQKKSNENNNTLIYDKNKIKQNEEMYSQIFQYKAITKFIEKHLKESSHSLCILRKIFQEHFLKKYNQVFLKIKQLADEEEKQELIKSEMEQMIEDFNEFLEFYLEVVRVYYNLDNLVNYLSETNNSFLTQDNLINFLCCIVITNQQMYDSVIKFIELSDLTIQQYQKNLKFLIKQPIDYFEIPDQFRLDEKTLLEFRKKNSEVRLTTLHKFKIPYQRVIQHFKKIETVKTPLHKLKIILKTAELIDECILNFYTEHKIPHNKKLKYDADQFLTIFIYIIVQSQITRLKEDLLLISYFTYKNTLNSVSGYLVTSLMCCVDYISRLENEKINIYHQNFRESYQEIKNIQFKSKKHSISFHQSNESSQNKK